jgi:hypothetical protein
VTLGVTASGCPAFLYQWYEGADINSGTAIPGETGATYSTPTALTEGTYRYYCTVSSSANPSKATSEVFTVNVMVNPAPVQHATTGLFTGKRCFDIAYSDADGNCGAFGPGSLRAEKKTVFSDRTMQDNMTLPAPPYTGVQVYTFRMVEGTARNVRFGYTDESMSVIDSMVVISTAVNSYGNMTEAKIAVYYKASLDEELKGRTNALALHAKLYVIFGEGGVDYKLEIDIMLQDCSCCDGAWITGGAWDFYKKTLRANEHIRIYDATTIITLNNDFTPAAVGDLCWYKKDATPTAVTPADYYCMNGSYADGDPDGGWRLPNIKELDYLYRQLPGTDGGLKTGEGSIPFFFGNSPDAAPLFNNGNNNNYSNNYLNSYLSISGAPGPNYWIMDFGNSLKIGMSNLTATNVRCVRRL